MLWRYSINLVTIAMAQTVERASGRHLLQLNMSTAVPRGHRPVNPADRTAVPLHRRRSSILCRAGPRTGRVRRRSLSPLAASSALLARLDREHRHVRAAFLFILFL